MNGQGEKAGTVDDFGALAVSSDEWEQPLRYLTLSQYSRPSVCPGWSAFDLANHVVGGAVRYRLLLQRSSTEVVEATRAEDHIGADPVLAHQRNAVALTAAFAKPGGLERTVAHRVGPRTGLELLRMRVLEQALHGWDLARTLETDDTLDDDLARYLLDNATTLLAELQAAGMYAATVTGKPHQTPAERLLQLAGRDLDRP